MSFEVPTASETRLKGFHFETRLEAARIEAHINLIAIGSSAFWWGMAGAFCSGCLAFLARFAMPYFEAHWRKWAYCEQRHLGH